MGKIAILIDSTSQISKKDAKEKGLFYLPLQIINGNETYLEGIDVTEKDIYQLFEKDKDLMLKTSQPAVGRVEEQIEAIKNAGYTSVLPLLIGSGISATFQSTIMAIKNAGLDVLEFDTKTTSAELGHMILTAKKMVDNNINGDEILTKLEEIRENSQTYFIVSDLAYLKAGGRITSAAAILGSMLKIIPILTLNKELNGMPDSLAKARSLKKVFNIIIDDFKQRGFNPETHKFIVMYGSDETKTEQLIASINEIWPSITIDTMPISLIVSSHTGPHIYGVQAIKK